MLGKFLNYVHSFPRSQLLFTASFSQSLMDAIKEDTRLVFEKETTLLSHLPQVFIKFEYMSRGKFQALIHCSEAHNINLMNS